jgi:hypothetical protein
MKGAGGACIRCAIVERSSGALRVVEVAADHLAGGRQHQRTAERQSDGCEPELKLGDDAEVAAAATNRPKEILVFGRADGDEFAIGGHYLHREQVIDGEAALADHEADAAARRQAADADGGRVAGRQREAVDLRRFYKVARGGAGLHARGAGLRVDLHAAHAGEVDDDGAIDHAVAAEAMAAAADGQRTVVVADEADRLDDVIRRRGADDGQRAAIVGDVVNLCAPRRSPWRWASRVRRRDRPGAIPDPARGSWRWCGES